MTYWTLVDDLLQAIPEVEPLLHEELDRWPDILDLPHIVFGDVLNLFVIELLSDSPANGEILQRIFAFFEEMAISEDDNVVGVLMATVLFRLDAPDILPQQILFMGKHVKVALELHRKQWVEIEEWTRQREDNPRPHHPKRKASPPWKKGS